MGEHGRGWGERRGPQPSSPNPLPRSESFPSSRPTSDDGAIPRATKPKPPAPIPHCTAYEGRPRPQTRQPPLGRHRPPSPPFPTKTDTPKTDDRPADLIIATVAHVPYPTAIQKATFRGVHGRKYGAIWVEYPGSTTLCEVSRPLLFPTLVAAERYWEDARAGKKKPKPPAPTNEESNPPDANPTTQPTNPTNPPSGPAKMWDPTTGSHEI